MLPSVGSYKLSPGNNNSTEGITIVLVGIPDSNEIDWVEVTKEE